MPKSKTHKELSERSVHLFKALVEHYINQGQPVGSRTLARETDLDLSPATIRNVMADLEDMGLITSPHTSSGRIPTAKGYRFFVDSLMRIDKLDSAEMKRIASELDPGADIKSLLERTSSMLSEITHLAGIVMLPRTEHKSLQHVEFVKLSDNRVLVILVMSDREVQNRIIQTAKPYSTAELQRASNYVNSHFIGKDLNNVREDILRELQKAKDDVNHVMQTAIEMAGSAIIKGDGHGDYLMAGQTNLMEVAELCDVDKLKRLFEIFSQKRDILHLLDQAIHARGLQIFIGEESGYEVLDACSVVTSPYEADGEILGVLGVIGPTRMPYERVIPIVDVTAKMLGTALNSDS
ncbi:heat-inducible transcriptional repressor [Methylohalomonas lacus]|uniref:Heat-inducible transcription repressor HrcA n=1 Tax=Methylohalomonas lacus TaxID=398773 RepID=A0AAE3L4D9_9GAMM|nr:heat-inducible transcriptional repressor HrcA [Methylohalomonas lacus]MCS3903698.1 heat-inducible transcriptional repressor [Methylohalomonas lacus]